MTLTIISGASKGIGAAIASDLKTLNHTLILLGKDNETNVSGEEYINEIDFNGNKCVYSYIKGILSYLVNKEQINIVLCAAQIGTANVLDIDEALDLFKINIIGNLAIIKAAAEYLPQKMRIVFFAGGGAAYAYPDFFGYSLTKVAVVRAVENLSIILRKTIPDVSIVALAPGAVNTDILKKVIEAGSEIKTRTDISEPVNFVRKFITDEFDSPALNGMFLHVRDDILNLKPIPQPQSMKKDLYKLRRIE